MAATGTKRSLPPKVSAMKARKRQKIEQPAGGDVASKKANAKPAKKPVSLDNMTWKEVSLPDRMDDYEGFFGLEEIDDVDVIRDASSGKVTFQARGDSHPEAADGATSEPDDDEWTGFGDEEPDRTAEKPIQQISEKKQKPENATKGQRPDEPKSTKEHKQQKESRETKASKQPKPTKAERKVNAKSEPSPQDSQITSGLFDGLDTAADEKNEVDTSAWLPLKLSPDTMSSLARLKFATPTSIQMATIPETLKGHDVIGKASTGSGKTLAFGIPILERFLEHRQNRQKSNSKWPLALILSPTRELAHQIHAHLLALCSNDLFQGPSIATITGGLSVQKQQRQIKDADIIIGTPGRLWEVMSDGKGIMKALQHIQFLIVDEADRLLNEGHFKEAEEILNVLDRKDTVIEDPSTAGDEQLRRPSAPVQVERQTLVFSATFDRGLQKKLTGKAKPEGDLMNNKESMEYLLAKLKFREEKPKFIDVNPVSQMATGLKEGLIECAGTEKDLYLYTLLLHYRKARTLVFANSISAVRRITPFLQNLGLPAMALHSGMIQKARMRSVERFTQSKDNSQGSILVATDVAARGLDIPNVQLVIHYHLPRAANVYVHRSGRTARAGQQGSSILICGPEEVAGVRRLIAKVHAQSAVAHQQSASEAAKQGYYMRTLDMDRRIVSRLRPRAQLAKKLADTTSAKEKQHKEDDFMRAAAEELGVDYDSEEFEKEAPGKHGRGSGRKKKERENREITKGEAAGMRAELKELLKQRVNVGVSEKYITSGRVDVDELLRQQELGGSKTGEFLGGVGGLGLEDI